jgi:hypothetical protein
MAKLMKQALSTEPGPKYVQFFPRRGGFISINQYNTVTKLFNTV